MSIDRQESLRNLGGMVARIRATGGTGRLALRNTVRLGMLHLYFERGQLVHLEGSHGSIDDALIDLAGWSDGLIRFDADVLAERQTVTPTQQEFFHRTLLLMQQRGVWGAAPRPAAQPPVQPETFTSPPQRSRPAPETHHDYLPSARPSSHNLPDDQWRLMRLFLQMEPTDICISRLRDPNQSGLAVLHLSPPRLR